MINESELSKEIETALGVDIPKVEIPKKGNGTRLSNITLAVELDNVIESFTTRIRQMETIKAAVEAMKASL